MYNSLISREIKGVQGCSLPRTARLIFLWRDELNKIIWQVQKKGKTSEVLGLPRTRLYVVWGSTVYFCLSLGKMKVIPHYTDALMNS